MKNHLFSSGEHVVIAPPRNHRRHLILMISVVLGLLVPATTMFAGENPNPGVLPPDSPQYGKTYGQWAAACGSGRSRCPPLRILCSILRTAVRGSRAKCGFSAGSSA